MILGAIPGVVVGCDQCWEVSNNQTHDAKIYRNFHFQWFSRKQNLVFLKFGVDVGRLFSSNIPVSYQTKSFLNWIGHRNLGKTWETWSTWGRAPQRGHGSSVPSLGSLAGSIEVRPMAFADEVFAMVCVYKSHGFRHEKRNEQRIISMHNVGFCMILRNRFYCKTRNCFGVTKR